MSTPLPDKASIKKRQARAVHVCVGVATLCSPIMMVLSVSVLPDKNFGMLTIAGICIYWLFYAFRDHVYQLGDLLEKKLGRSVPEDVQELAAVSNTDALHWPSVSVNVSVLMAVCFLTAIVARGIQTPSDNEKQKQITAYIQKSQATVVYWQTAVGKLHAIRFQTPAGQEPAEQYYEHVAEQLRVGGNAAKSVSTVNVDPELTRMVNNHLAVDNEFLELRQKLNEFMQQQHIPIPTDTVDQRMKTAQLLVGIVQANPEVVEKIPSGPERDLIEKGLVLEQLRQVQLREIEIMQAVLQERYKGVPFPLPVINQ